MANLFNKIWSGLDFWDKAENQQQRQQFSQQDEEDKKRKQQQQQSARASAARNNNTAPQGQLQDQQAEDPKSFTQKVASQSQSNIPDPRTLLSKSIDQVNPFDDGRSFKEAGLQKDPNWIQRNLSDTGRFNIIKEGVQGIARVAPTLILSGEEQSRRNAMEAKQASTDKIMQMSYEQRLAAFKSNPELSTLFSTGDPTDANLTASLNKTKSKTGTPKWQPSGWQKRLFGDKPIDTYQEQGRTSTAAGDQLLDETGIAKESPTRQRFTSPVVGGAFFALDTFTGGKGSSAKPVLKSTLKKLAESSDEGVIRNLLTGLGKDASDDIVETIVKTEDPKAINSLINKTPDAPPIAPKPSSNPESVNMPGKYIDNGPTSEPSIKVSEGIESTNLPKTQPVRPAGQATTVPDATDPRALAKAEGGQPVQQVPGQNPQPKIDVPLQKYQAPEQAIPGAEPTLTDTAQAAQSGEVPVSTRVDANGNPINMTDAEYQQQLAEQGLAPQRGDSPISAAEAEYEKARQQAINDEVNLPDNRFDEPAYLRAEDRRAAQAIEDEQYLATQRQAEVDLADQFDAPAYERQGKQLPGQTPEDINARLTQNADQISIDPQFAEDIGKSYRITGASNPLSLVMHVLSNTPDKGKVRAIVERLLPEADNNTLNRAVNSITGAHKVEDIADALDEAARASSGPDLPFGQLSDAPAPKPAGFQEPVVNSGAVPETAPVKDAPVVENQGPSGQQIMADMTRAEDAPPVKDAPVTNQAPVEQGPPTTQPVTEQAPPVRNEGSTAPNTRDSIVNSVDDPGLQSQMIEGATPKEVTNLAESKANGLAQINSIKDDGELARRYSNPDAIALSNPEDGYAALAAKDRLSRVDTPEARAAVVNITNAVADKSSESGLWLRFSQVLFDHLSPAEKADTLIAKLNKAGASMGDQTDEVRTQLLNLVEKADETGRSLKEIDDLIAQTKEKIATGELNGDQAKTISKDLLDKRKQVEDQFHLENGDVMDYFDQHIPKGALGARAGRTGRLAMLSSPMGRIFDLISTTGSALAKASDSTGAAVMGKIGNKLTKAGNFESKLPSATAPFKDSKRALSKVRADWKGNRRVDSISDELARKTKSDIKQTTGWWSRKVKAAVESPTELTKYIEGQNLTSKGYQQAEKLGLKGKDAKAYADLHAVSATEAEKYAARQDWFKANAIHDNVISNKLNLVAKQIDETAGGWGSIVRNMVIPFTSFFGGQAHLALTDRNVIYNAFSATKNFRRGDPQAAIKDLSKLGTNTTTAVAASYLLASNGILTDKDANGDTYDGVYIHIGNRYYPVAIAGQFAPALIFGYSINQGKDAKNPMEAALDIFSNTVAGVAKSTDIAATFGGNNSLMSKLRDFDQINVGKDGEAGNKIKGIVAATASDVAGQYIPAITGDINSILDYTGLNKTKEKADTNAYEINPDTGEPTKKKNQAQTALNKFLNKIPGASQALPRKAGVNAKDAFDRIGKGSHETGEQKDARQKDESIADMKKRLEADKVPTTDDNITKSIDSEDYDKALQGLNYRLEVAKNNPNGAKSDIEKLDKKIKEVGLLKEDVSVETKGIDARVERGEYGKALKGLEYQLEAAKNDKNVPESTAKDLETNITRLKVTEKGKYRPDIIALYKDTSNSEWRAMGDPDDPDYRPEAFQLLAQYDAEMAAAGVSRYDADPKKGKFFAKTSGRGGGGGSGSKTKISTSIATQSVSSAFKPIKAQGATKSGKDSTIPVLAKVPINDKSKLKKISVSKGGL